MSKWALDCFENIAIEESIKKCKDGLDNSFMRDFGITKRIIIKSQNNYKRMHHKPMRRYKAVIIKSNINYE